MDLFRKISNHLALIYPGKRRCRDRSLASAADLSRSTDQEDKKTNAPKYQQVSLL